MNTHDCATNSANSREYPSSSAYTWLSDVNLWCIHIVIVHFSCPFRTGRDWCKLARVLSTQHGHCVRSPINAHGELATGKSVLVVAAADPPLFDTLVVAAALVVAAVAVVLVVPEVAGVLFAPRLGLQ